MVFMVNASDLEDCAAFAKAPQVVAYQSGKAKVLGGNKGGGFGNLRLAGQGQARNLRLVGTRLRP